MISVPKATWNVLGRLRALVIGDPMLDSYLSGASHRLCQEAPVPVVDVGERLDVPGGAANSPRTWHRWACRQYSWGRWATITKASSFAGFCSGRAWWSIASWPRLAAARC